ncbi:hypothetical protein [Mycolicibacterium vanbaalenii]|nr:hypothetical protein [Mycolicibacterium vanbaalenii]MCV7126835.1 hypothetical protein [Mycolicibacterium vanbaalenii PYR-1]
MSDIYQRDRRRATNEFTRRRAQVAALSRGVRTPNDPLIEEARRAMIRAQQTVAAHAVLDSTEARVSGDPDRMTEILRSAGVPVAVLLLESVELLAYVVSLSDRPAELLAALHERVDPAPTD